MGIQVKCWKCSRMLVVDDSFAGKEGRCPFCQTPVVVPGSEEQVAKAEPVSPEPQPEGTPPAWSEASRPEVGDDADAAEPEAPQPEAKPSSRPPVAKWALLGGAALIVLSLLTAIAWYGTLWLYQGEPEQVARPQPSPVEPPEEPEPDEPGPGTTEPSDNKPPEEPKEPAEPPPPEFPLTMQVASRIPPGSVAYAEVPHPSQLLADLGDLRYWKAGAGAEDIISGGLEELAHSVANELRISGRALVAAGGRVKSLHLCVVEWLPKPSWAVLAKFGKPVTLEEIVGDQYKRLARSGRWRGFTTYRLRLRSTFSNMRTAGAICEDYAIVASDDSALRRVLQSVSNPPGEGPFPRPTMADLPAFEKALATRPENGGLWMFVDIPRLVEQTAGASRHQARTLTKLQTVYDLDSIAGISGVLDPAGRPAISIDVMLKGEQPLLGALSGPPLQPRLPRGVPVDASFVARISLADPSAAFADAGEIFDPLADFAGIEAKAIDANIDKHMGRAAWQKVPSALGGEALLFAMKHLQVPDDFGVLARVKDKASLKAVTDAAGTAPALKELEFVEEDVGGVTFVHPKKNDTFPCYAVLGRYAMLAARQSVAKSAIEAYNADAGPAIAPADEALRRLGDGASVVVAAKLEAMTTDDKGLVKPDAWLAAGCELGPDRFGLRFSDVPPFPDIMKTLAEEAEKADKRLLAECRRNLHEIGEAILVAAAGDPQLLYPKNLNGLLKLGKIKDKSIFRCPLDPQPVKQNGIEMSYEFIFEHVKGRVKLDLPEDCIIAWDRKGNHEGKRSVVFVNGKSRTVSEETFMKMLVHATKQAKKFSAKTVELPK